MRSIALLACGLGAVLAASCKDDPDPSEDLPPILDWDPASIPPVDTSPGISDAAAPDTWQPPAGGYDAGTCTGSPWSCSLASSPCTTVKGCSEERACTGYASGCYGRYSSSSCNGQRGCYWSYSSGNCSGSATPCSLLSTLTCSSQSGCRIETSCKGVATSCSSLSPSECRSQPGCSVR